MKVPKHFLFALLGATCLGIVAGMTFMQAQADASQQPARPVMFVGNPAQQSGGNLNQPTPRQQTPKPELDVKPGDSEEIKALKTEIKELRERVFKLEEKTSWRIRPATER
jgi:hypothetical protein